jgi:HEPN domain-containing protein
LCQFRAQKFISGNCSGRTGESSTRAISALADNAHGILWSADCFRLSARLLFEEVLQRKKRFALGFAVLAAFSVELYLKCLLLIEARQYPETHNLKKLFAQLKPETKSELRKKHDARAERVAELGKLEELLEQGQDAFERFRYPFEKGEETGFALNWLGEVVRQKIISLHPDWEADDAIFPIH